MFTLDQNKVYREIDAQVNMEKIIPDTAKSTTFWSEIWDDPIRHRQDAEMVKKIEVQTVSINVQLEEVRMTKTQVETHCKKIPN